jgi:hypothetical protein
VCHLHKDDVHVTVFDSTDFLTTNDLAEYAALQGQTFSLIGTAPGDCCGIFIDTCLNHQWVVCQNSCEFCTHDVFL